jgi:phosphopantothenoylcysteine synthetase/decarboxylase
MFPITFLITSGPTREYIDPVRFLSNASSGKMGKALAEAAAQKGYSVIFVTGPVADLPSHKNIRIVPVISAKEMFIAVKQQLAAAHIVIGAAAVADYRPMSSYKHKIKKTGEILNLQLTPNPDIIRYVGRHKKKKTIIGFALESRNLIEYARKKLYEKNLDAIVANSSETIGSRNASVLILEKSGAVITVKNKDKKFIAKRIIDETIRIWTHSTVAQKRR